MKWSDSTFAWELGIDVEYWTEPQDERAVVAPGLLKDVVGLTNPVFPHRLNLVAYPSSNGFVLTPFTEPSSKIG